MTLELSQVAPQVKAMGQSLAEQKTLRDDSTEQALILLQNFSTQFTALEERIQRAEQVQQEKQRFGWVGAAPTAEALAETYPLPPYPEFVTIVASDGSQIMPDPHAITLYYLINTGCIVYRHGSNQKPVTHNPKPSLHYLPNDIFDEQGRLISPGEVNVQRDIDELKVLTYLAPTYSRGGKEPVIALMDGQLTLRVIDLPNDTMRQDFQDQYIEMLNTLREENTILGSYIDRPRSTFVLSLLHLASLQMEAITEENLRLNPFRHLTDIDIFQHRLGPGQRSAMFATKVKGVEKYNQAGHGIHFFYLNVSPSEAQTILARVEVPAWVAANPQSLDTLHATLVRQARITGSYPYVLARADELAVISSEEREAVEMMLAIEMRRHGLRPEISLKQRNKNAFRASKESFQL